MKAIVASGFGEPDTVLASADVPPPPSPSGNQLLVRVIAASLTPGDYRMLLGDASAVKRPKAGFPYTPGGDVAGEVLATGTSAAAAAFSVGDRVVATWHGVAGEGAMAEKAIIDARTTVHLPPAVGAREGVALVNSACHALQAVRDSAAVKPGDRVLVLGGSGGVGSVAVQLARKAGAVYVAATSTQGEMLRALGVDRVVDYRSEDWATVKEFREDRFDVIIDCAEGRVAWENPGLGNVLKNGNEGGRFVAVVGDQWYIEVKSLWQMPGVLGPSLLRQLRSSFSKGKVPRYRFFLGSTPAETIAEVMRMAADGEIRAVLDDRSPLPFDEKGVKDAFNIMISRRAHGKIVVEM